jgi:hypothetical protein
MTRNSSFSVRAATREMGAPLPPRKDAQTSAAGFANAEPAVIYCQLPGCGKPIIKRSNEARHVYVNRKYCCAKHSGQAANLRLRAGSERHCEQCGAVIIRKSGENHHRFMARRFCDRTCEGKAQIRQKKRYTTVEEYIANVGLTLCPPRYCSPTGEAIIRPSLYAWRRPAP